MIKQLVVILLIFSFRLQSQPDPDFRIVEHSGYKHEYVPQRAAYLESMQDLARLKYIATVEISGPHYNLPILANWLGLLRIKARELGASLYYVTGYTEDPVNASVQVKLYFGPGAVYDKNEEQYLRGTVYVLNEFRFANDSNSFYADKVKHVIAGTSLSAIKPANKRYSLISANNTQVTTLKAKLKDGRSVFTVVPVVHGDIRTKYYLGPNGQLFVRNNYLMFKFNKPWQLDYQAGRLILGAWQLTHPL